MPADPPTSSIPSDDLSRNLTVAKPDQDETLSHLGLVGDTYTILVSGSDTRGVYTLIDMHVPRGPTRFRGDVHRPGGPGRGDVPL